uniref:Hypothetical secreted protein n=1 Tax=Glossina morsitans morsitans TaxID=37546 RepID=D3TSH0_GLOMM
MLIVFSIIKIVIYFLTAVTGFDVVFPVLIIFVMVNLTIFVSSIAIITFITIVVIIFVTLIILTTLVIIFIIEIVAFVVIATIIVVFRIKLFSIFAIPTIVALIIKVLCFPFTSFVTFVQAVVFFILTLLRIVLKVAFVMKPRFFSSLCSSISLPLIF